MEIKHGQVASASELTFSLYDWDSESAQEMIGEAVLSADFVSKVCLAPGTHTQSLSLSLSLTPTHTHTHTHTHTYTHADGWRCSGSLDVTTVEGVQVYGHSKVPTRIRVHLSVHHGGDEPWETPTFAAGMPVSECQYIWEVSKETYIMAKETYNIFS